MTVPIVQVDAFANLPFTGNPAAVTLLEEEPSASWMQRLAAEMNLSETAFLWPEDEGYGLRWFTPETEVDLCGHATLAAAHVLFETERPDPEEPVTFDTKGGQLTCEHEEPWIRMRFPAHPPEASDDDREAIAQALDAKPTWTGANELDRFAVLDDETAVRQLEPNLETVAGLDARGLIVTAPADDGSDVDFVSRFFAPAAGVDEDPVTGSAHCALGPYWADEFGEDEVVGRQVSRRGGLVRVTVEDGEVELAGQAVTVFEGELTDDAAP
jgi:PhzF family phenazine biosynthesis protein